MRQFERTSRQGVCREVFRRLSVTTDRRGEQTCEMTTFGSPSDKPDDEVLEAVQLWTARATNSPDKASQRRPSKRVWQPTRHAPKHESVVCCNSAERTNSCGVINPISGGVDALSDAPEVIEHRLALRALIDAEAANRLLVLPHLAVRGSQGANNVWTWALSHAPNDM